MPWSHFCYFFTKCWFSICHLCNKMKTITPFKVFFVHLLRIWVTCNGLDVALILFSFLQRLKQRIQSFFILSCKACPSVDEQLNDGCIRLQCMCMESLLPLDVRDIMQPRVWYAWHGMQEGVALKIEGICGCDLMGLQPLPHHLSGYNQLEQLLEKHLTSELLQRYLPWLSHPHLPQR